MQNSAEFFCMVGPAPFQIFESEQHTMVKSSPLSPLTPRSTSGYGWIADLPDVRDYTYKPAYGAQKATPSSADLTKVKGYFDPYQQARLGSCTGNGIAGCLEFDALVQGTPIETPSRLFIYYGERYIEGTVNQDAGAQIRDGVKVVAKLGAPPESLWPYSDDPQTFKKRPSDAAFAAATQDAALVYRRLTRDKNLTQFRARIGVDGRPFVFGFTVYESFESDTVARTGIMPMPEPGEQVLGGHCVVGVGYDDKKQRVKCRNSWGKDWGLAGHFWMPYDYFRQRALTSDFWVIEKTGALAA